MIIGAGDEGRLRREPEPTSISGFKSDEVVKEYRKLPCFYFPGRDFGIVIEIYMACGKPVLAFRRASLKPHS